MAVSIALLFRLPRSNEPQACGSRVRRRAYPLPTRFASGRHRAGHVECAPGGGPPRPRLKGTNVRNRTATLCSRAPRASADPPFDRAVSHSCRAALASTEKSITKVILRAQIAVLLRSSFLDADVDGSISQRCIDPAPISERAEDGYRDIQGVRVDGEAAFLARGGDKLARECMDLEFRRLYRRAKPSIRPVADVPVLKAAGADSGRGSMKIALAGVLKRSRKGNDDKRQARLT